MPWQPPSTLEHTTNQRSVSIGRPGPTRPSHQPGSGWPRPAGPVTWLSPVQAWQISTAFERRRVERAPRLVGDGDVGQRRAALEGERAGRGRTSGTGGGRAGRRASRHRSRAARCAWPRSPMPSARVLQRLGCRIAPATSRPVVGDGNGTLGRSPRLPGPQAARNAGRNLPAGWRSFPGSFDGADHRLGVHPVLVEPGLVGQEAVGVGVERAARPRTARRGTRRRRS